MKLFYGMALASEKFSNILKNSFSKEKFGTLL